ncbi:hypothetical protein FF1_043300 [Malus domestica]
MLDHQIKGFIPVEYLEKPSIDKKPTVKVAQINTTRSWQDPIIDYIINGKFPTDRLESKKLQMKAARYYMWNGIFVQRSFSRPHLHYLSPPDNLNILCSIHKSICGNHSRGRSLA